MTSFSIPLHKEFHSTMTSIDATLTHQSFDKPSQHKELGKVKVDMITFGDKNVARLQAEPGMKWSTDVKPFTRTELCNHAHIGYVVSGSMMLTLADGSMHTINADDFYVIPPGHDSEVLGNIPFVGYDVNNNEKLNDNELYRISFKTPSYSKIVPNGLLDVIEFPNRITMMRATLQPGFRWSRDIGIPTLHKEYCDHEHMGFLLQGILGVKLENGDDYTINAGEAFHIKPQHDVYVQGSEPVLFFDSITDVELFNRKYKNNAMFLTDSIRRCACLG